MSYVFFFFCQSPARVGGHGAANWLVGSYFLYHSHRDFHGLEWALVKFACRASPSACL